MNKKNKITAKGKKRLPIGISSFKKLRENDYYYIDKTLFILDVIEASAEALLLPRPRRFGKTLNLSMLRYFFEKSEEDRSGLFDGLTIRNDEVFFEHQGRYPVIYLTFKDMKSRNWEDLYEGLCKVISEEIERHVKILNSDCLSVTDRNYFESLIELKGSRRSFEDSLRILCGALNRYHNKRVVILIDEYDTPLHAGYTNGYYREVIDFMSA